MLSRSSEPRELNSIEWWDIPFCEIDERIQTMSKQKDYYKTILEVANFPSVPLDMARVLVLALTTIL